MEMSHPAAALPYLQKARVEEPNSLQVLSTLGLALTAVGRRNEAIVHFHHATQLKPEFPEDYYHLGVAFLNTGSPQNAEKAFRRLLELSPGYEEAQIQLANSLLIQGRANLGNSINPVKLREAADEFRVAVKSVPENPELHFNYATTLGLLGDQEAAATEYTEVIRLQPNFPLAEFNLGATYYQLRDWENAGIHLRKAVAKDPKDFPAQYYLGCVLLKTGDPEAAKAHLVLASHLRPDHPGVHYQLAEVYHKLGDAEGASAEYRIVKEQSRVDALERSAMFDTVSGDNETVVNAMKQLYEARGDVESGRNLALALLRKGDLAEARRLLEHLLAVSPHDAVSHNYLGVLESKAGNLPAAQQQFEAAARLDPSYHDALFNAGLGASRLGRTEAAIRYLLAALAVSDTPQVRTALAAVYADAGRMEESREQFEAAEKLQGQPTPMH
jgi:tetratricopeptide (TPR) repeat protein